MNDLAILYKSKLNMNTVVIEFEVNADSQPVNKGDDKCEKLRVKS